MLGRIWCGEIILRNIKLREINVDTFISRREKIGIKFCNKCDYIYYGKPGK